MAPIKLPCLVGGECDFETVSPEADADTDAETGADAPCVDAPEDDVVAKLKEGFHYCAWKLWTPFAS